MVRNERMIGRDRVALNLAKIRIEGDEFQVVVDADKAIALRNGASVDIRDALRSEEIFSDAQKGNLAAEHALEKAFDTTNKVEIAKQIIQKGEIQLTSEYRDKLREEKRRRILEIIRRNGADPQTGLPHPARRIENAMEEAGAHIDEHKRAEDQVQDVLKKIRTVLPISFEVRQISIHLPAQFAAKGYGTIKNYGEIVKDEWQNDGSLVSVVKVAAGLQQEFFSELNSLTHGTVETRIISKS